MRVTIYGLPGAESVMVIVPVRVPPPLGIKVICTVQLAAANNVARQLLVSAKSPGAATKHMEIEVRRHLNDAARNHTFVPEFCTVTPALGLECSSVGEFRSVILDTIHFIGLIDRAGTNSVQAIVERPQQFAAGSVNVLAMRGKKNHRTRLPQ